MSLSMIREHYGVPAYRGRVVTIDGRRGVITSSPPGTMHIRVRFEDGTHVPAHPTWRVDYEPDVEPG